MFETTCENDLFKWYWMLFVVHDIGFIPGCLESQSPKKWRVCHQLPYQIQWFMSWCSSINPKNPKEKQSVTETTTYYGYFWLIISWFLFNSSFSGLTCGTTYPFFPNWLDPTIAPSSWSQAPYVWSRARSWRRPGPWRTPPDTSRTATQRVFQHGEATKTVGKSQELKKKVLVDVLHTSTWTFLTLNMLTSANAESVESAQGLHIHQEFHLPSE